MGRQRSPLAQPTPAAGRRVLVSGAFARRRPWRTVLTSTDDAVDRLHPPNNRGSSLHTVTVNIVGAADDVLVEQISTLHRDERDYVPAATSILDLGAAAAHPAATPINVCHGRRSQGHDVGMPLTISVLADRPDLAGPMWGMPNSWPEFMRHDPIGGLFYGNVETRFAEFVLVAQDDAAQAVACAYSIPFVLGDDALPDNGWDFVIRNGLLANVNGQTPDAISAVEIAVRPDHQGTGVSRQMLTALRSNAARRGFAQLVAPVRPNGKADVHEPMSTYAFRKRQDGLPVDPWLRVHVRAGGRIAKVAPRSMVVPGTLEEWREWTGLPFDRTGPVLVPQALTPIYCDIDLGVAAYVEPNVWVVHRTGG